MDQALQDFASSISSDAVRMFISAAYDIEQEAQETDQEILGTTVHVSGFVRNGTNVSEAASAFSGTGDSADAAFNKSLYGRDELVSGDQAVVDSVLSQVTSLSDVIVFSFELSNDIVQFIYDRLAIHSPFRSGRYMHSHVVYADGELVGDLSQLAEDSKDAFNNSQPNEFIFVSTLPYARKIEQGESAMAPHGVYEIVAQEAQERYGAQYDISFIDYVGVAEGMAQSPKAKAGYRTKRHFNRTQNRFPAIRVRNLQA